ncbi:MAG: helix-turn-helix transcriptional regulator [Bacteroidales bacterium]|nr:helix-turn-helix transcriptional regulator [Bacteroidales bacterium]
MEKRHITAHIECNSNGFYTVYFDDELPFGCYGEGYSANEAREDFLKVYEGMRLKHLERTGENVEVEFDFVYDASAFLQHYKGLLTLAGLSRMTGINKAQLSQYVTGHRHPSPKTQEKIKMSVQQFAQELSCAMA